MKQWENVFKYLQQVNIYFSTSNSNWDLIRLSKCQYRILFKLTDREMEFKWVDLLFFLYIEILAFMMAHANVYNPGKCVKEVGERSTGYQWLPT